MSNNQPRRSSRVSRTSLENGFFDSPLLGRPEGQVMEDVRRFYEVHIRDQLDSSDVSLRSLKRGAWLAVHPANMKRFAQSKLRSLSRAPTTAAVSYLARPPDGSIEMNEINHNGTTREESPLQPSDAEPLFLSSEDKFLTSFEDEALKKENDRSITSLPKDLWIILATCAVGAIVQGWSQESIVGANLLWPLDFLSDKPLEGTKLKYFALVNAMPYFAASIFGVWASDPLTDLFGRRTALFFAAVCSLVAPIVGAFSTSWHVLLAARLIQGIGMGAKSSVIPVLESEVAPAKMRGKLLVSWQAFVAVGIFLGATINLIFYNNWRLQFGLSFVPAVPLLCFCYAIPESPRWLVKKGRYREAYQVLRKVRQTQLQATRDLYDIYAHVQTSVLFSKKNRNRSLDELFQDPKAYQENQPSFFSKLPKLFTNRRNRRAVVAASIAMISQQFTGINIFAFLATTSFSVNDHLANLWLDFGFGLANAIASLLTFLIIEKLGRRTLLLSSLILMFPFLLLMGHFGSKDSASTKVVLLIIYTIIYSPGAGVIPFMYSSEVFPLSYRETGMSLACAVNLSLAGAVAMSVPIYQEAVKDKPMKVFGTFAGLDILAAFLVWLWMRSPEEAVSLESMSYLFGARSIDYIRYQFEVVLPWAATLKPFRKDIPPKDSFSQVIYATQSRIGDLLSCGSSDSVDIWLPLGKEVSVELDIKS